MRRILCIILSVVGLMALAAISYNAYTFVTTPSISGLVTSIDSYGSVHTSFTIEQMLAKGFDYADIVKVEFGESGTYVMPITTAYTEVGVGKPSYCHYSKRGEASFGYCQGDFHLMCGGNPGETVKITMYEKQGYAKEYQLIQSVYYTERERYDSDEAFANFRELKQGGIAPNTVYRSGNPMNFVSNPERYIYVDRLAAQTGIKSEIDIANTLDQDMSYVSDTAYRAGGYCADLLKHGNVECLGMGSNTFCESAYEKFATGMRFIIAHEPPFLIHCNEGKDRCGFYCMLLEAISGATVQEMQYDYMTTFCNLYYFKRDTEQYDFNLSLTGNRLIYLMRYPEVISEPNFDWTSINISEIDPYDAAHFYLTEKCGLDEREIQLLINKLSDK